MLCRDSSNFCGPCRRSGTAALLSAALSNSPQRCPIRRGTGPSPGRGPSPQNGPSPQGGLIPHGGEGGIRTRGTVARTHDFQSCTFGRSVTSPGRGSRIESRDPPVFAVHRDEREFSAERVGFEPTVGVNPHLISNQAPSASRSSLRAGSWQRPPLLSSTSWAYLGEFCGRGGSVIR